MSALVMHTPQQSTHVFRRAAISDTPNILSEIYQDDVNIAIWKNGLSAQTQDEAKQLIFDEGKLNLEIAAGPDDVITQLVSKHPSLINTHQLNQHIQTLVDMFCTLFELKRAGIRLSILEQAMCPKLHVDKIPCRLVSTFSGPATQWISHQDVVYSKLGKASFNVSDDMSGIYTDALHIQTMRTGDVALLKGSNWQNNEMAGLVHRSPQQTDNEKRLVITLDFID
jgi:hypothetical protein